MSIAFDPPHISAELPVQSMLQSLEEIGAPGDSITLLQSKKKIICLIISNE